MNLPVETIVTKAGRRSPLKSTRPGHELGAPSNVNTPRSFRQLNGSELVRRGDFVMDDVQVLQPWDGPNGFRADAYVKPVYRSEEEAYDPNNT
jgi:hypothetical protein